MFARDEHACVVAPSGQQRQQHDAETVQVVRGAGTARGRVNQRTAIRAHRHRARTECSVGGAPFVGEYERE